MNLNAEFEDMTTKCQRLKSVYNNARATMSDLQITKMDSGDSTEIEASRRLAIAALPKAKKIALTQYNPTFFLRISTAFDALTKPHSNIENPAAIQKTNAPESKSKKVLKIY